MKKVLFADLKSADLVVDAVYEGDASSNTYGSEPIHHLLPGTGNQGGFRKVKAKIGGIVGIVLTSTGSEKDWPDQLNQYDGTYIYFGDNRHPGRDLHDTHVSGNKSLKEMFHLSHGTAEDRKKCPLIFIFEKSSVGRDMVFRGMAVPGGESISSNDELVAIWRTSDGQRFQNYKALFTILDAGIISGDWVRNVWKTGDVDWDDSRIPKALISWIKNRKYSPLKAAPAEIRSSESQMPKEGIESELIRTVFDYCTDNPTSFEPVAARIWEISTKLPLSYEITRASRDGGRDAFGFIALGPNDDPIQLSFALEAKCYALNNSVGVKEMSRLISRIKHREFGVMVTTSVISPQAYKEVRDDGHPIVILSASDISKVLISFGINSKAACLDWLQANFPK
jgi:hypothetical protein